jgi:hypothetical protein
MNELEQVRADLASAHEEIARLHKSNDALVEMATPFRANVEYEIRRSEKEGDDEGARMKTFTLSQIIAALSTQPSEESYGEVAAMREWCAPATIDEEEK